MVKDIRGQDINVGDHIVYAQNGYGRSSVLNEYRVESFTPKQMRVSDVKLNSYNGKRGERNLNQSKAAEAALVIGKLPPWPPLLCTNCGGDHEFKDQKMCSHIAQWG